jgi:hypothetical protein
MSGQVVLYFDDQADALRFALAAGSVMAGGEPRATDDLVQETARATRIRVDSANNAASGNGKSKKSSPPERVA